MQNTTNFNLKKPEYTDPVDIQDINDNMDIIDTQLQGKTTKTTQIVAGNGLTGGGALDTSRTITLGTPTSVTNATTNSVTTTGHTHALTLTKADITGLGIPANDTNTEYSAGANVQISGTVISATNTTYTKSSLGLGNVTNDKQMPISGGTLETYTEKLQATTGVMNLNLANVFTDTPSANRTYSITNAKSGVSHSFTLYITMGATVRTLTFPAGVKWAGDEIPDMTTANKTYILTFSTINGGTTWFGNGSDY